MIMDLKSYPSAFKNALIYFFCGWIWLFFSLYHYFFNNDLAGGKGKILTQLAIIAILNAIFLFSVKNWGRILCLLSNTMIILYFLFIGAVFFMRGQVLFGIVSAFTIGLFCMSSYYLAVKSTATFFKENSKKPAEAEHDPDEQP